MFCFVVVTIISRELLMTDNSDIIEIDERRWDF